MADDTANLRPSDVDEVDELEEDLEVLEDDDLAVDELEDEIDDELIAVIQSDKRICPYLDMPIQHISDPMLKAMHRTTSKEEILAIIGKLRAEIPGVSIRTSLMVGFPGETEEQFEEMLDFVKKVPLDNVGIFKFSLEKEAYAARLPDQIAEEVKQERFERLAAAQLKTLRKQMKRWIGKKVSAIVEGFHPESKMLLRARHSGQCPDIDGQIIINDGRKVTGFGKLYEVEITDVTDYDLIGSVLGPDRGGAPSKSRLSLALVSD